METNSGTPGGEHSHGDVCSVGAACGNGKDSKELGRCVCVCDGVGSGEEGHEAEIALRIHYARLSS